MNKAILPGLACVLAACAARTPAQQRHQIVPLVDHHQHIFGPNAIVIPDPKLPAVTLPSELDRLLKQRESISGTNNLGAVYLDGAQIVDISDGDDHWARSEAAFVRTVSFHPQGTRFIPNAYAISDSVGYIAGVVRSGAESNDDDMLFVLGLKKNAVGQWRIAVESAMLKPPYAFGQPITAEKVIQVMDDAGIRKAVVLSVAYWLGGALFNFASIADEYAKTRAENDWVIEQVARYPDRLVAFCGVNPLKVYALAEIERCAKLPNVKGIKLHLGSSRVDLKKPGDVEQLQRVFRTANNQKLAIAIHLWHGPDYGRKYAQIFFDQVLPAAPDVVVQIAHMAGAGRYVYDEALAVFADAIEQRDPRMKNVYFDLTTVVNETMPQNSIDQLARRLRQIGLERILFGADTPIINRPPPLLSWATFRRRIPLTDQELRTIADNVAPYLR